MAHDSRWCESRGGGWGHLKNRRRKSEPQCGRKKKRNDAYEGDFSVTTKLWRIFMVPGNLSSPLFLCPGLRAVLAPSLRALIKTRVPNGP